MKFAIYGQACKPITQNIIERLLKVLRSHSSKVIFEDLFHNMLLKNNILEDTYETFSSKKDLDDSIDFFIGIGGDGTLLRAANFVKSKNIPIVGINAGRLGFLANVQQDAIEELLPLLFTGEYKLSKRSLLSLECIPEPEKKFELDYALNEITVSRKNSTSMITIDTYLNDEFLASYWADGLIISTPSGSTGYSLSCGGPIIAPETSCLVITPLAPHNLNVRPLVIPDLTHLKLKVSSREPQFLISLDAETKAIENNTEIHISKAPFTVNMVEFANQSFIKTLRNKLLWGEDKRN